FRGLGQLLPRRLAPEPRLQRTPDTRKLEPALVDVRRHADRRRLVRDRALTGLPDPPGGVRRELEAAPPVELLDGTVEPDDAVLDQVEQWDVVSLIALGDRDHEPEVGVDHALLGRGIAALDPLRERYLFGRREQRIAARPVHEL